ncbi:peptidoglycan DD-metalloendopeptidase family protein [Rothia nasimurium]|uniref:peptidoglycan DD-metalloendopeptidase family protein n=1 Tax=Rothia nasimurium TaxID=85336 RepID=UPI003BA3AD7E
MSMTTLIFRLSASALRLTVFLVAVGILLLPPAPSGATSSFPFSASSWVPPVGQGLEVVRGFEKPDARWSAGHRGVDLALEAGGEILAPHEGEVVFAGTVVDRQVLTLEHPDGRRSSFEPVTSPLPVGSLVQAGDVIAHLDPDVQHCAPRFCLHWGVRQPVPSGGDASNGLDYVNPLLLLGQVGPSVLLPIGDDFSA